MFVSPAILTLTCADRPGIVSSVSRAILEAEGNILESAQFGDSETGRFFIRTVVDAAVAGVDALEERLARPCAALEARWSLAPADRATRVLIMVSHLDHALSDLLYRWRIGELRMDIVAVVSNHETSRKAVEEFGIEFFYIPVTPETRMRAEEQLLDILHQTEAELVVLARYMQVLSDRICEALEGRAINIHHSFLPGFKGARPYHQAHHRGVKLIGATAHFVTADLDEGPIIEQDVARVSHARTPQDLIAIGREVECRVLAGAVRLFLERRVFLNGIRTVVFD